jgi:hypothetical protein
MNNNLTKISGILSIAFLLGSFIPNLPYGYFEFLRWVVTLTAIFYIFQAYKLSKTGIVTAGILLAILFNPIASIHLDRSLWLILDLISAFVIGIMMINLQKHGKEIHE